VQNADRLLVELPPDVAIAAQDVIEFGAGEVGEHFAQARQADAGTAFVDDLEDVIALFAGRIADRPAERMGRELVAREDLLPVAYGARREVQEPGGLFLSPTLGDNASASLDDVPAHGLFLFPLAALAGEAALRRTFANRFLGQPPAQMIHDCFFGTGGRLRRRRGAGVADVFF
jgi:hypothetical protein